jgi:cation diffusion facilitator family transporter
MSEIAIDHDHVFLGEGHQRNERRVRLVIALTASMMALEIAAGMIFGSMALVADGWHMSTHAAAMLISALAYLYARRHARDPRFSFGTGKLGDLAGFASAIGLALVALLIGWESLLRLAEPVPIHYEQAIAVAVLGLAVNLASAWLLHDGGYHHPGHGHHDHGQGHAHGADNNLRAAYLHVMADALTSVLAIAALLLGWLNGWTWADPLMGVVGALVIARWSWGLIRDTGGVLLDQVPEGGHVAGEVREALAQEPVTITDLHVWQIGPGHNAAIVVLQATQPKAPDDYRALLAGIHDLSHVTIEVSDRMA